MAITSARSIVDIKEKGHFEHDDTRVDKYTLGDELPAKLSELRLRPRTMATLQPEYTVRKLTPADKEPVLNFLRRFFFRDEPMNTAVNLLETPDARCLELEDYSVSTLEDEVSVAAVNEKGQLVGVIINGIVSREDSAASSDKSGDCPNPKFQRILNVLCHLDREARIWDKLPQDCNKVLEVRIASTDVAWRGKGLMRALCEESERIALEHGAGALRMDATSAFSAAAAERLHYKCLYSIRYDCLPYNIKPDPPHFEARVYVKEI